MKRRICLILGLCILLLLSLSGCSSQQTLRFGTGSEGGTYYAYGTALAPSLEEDTGAAVEVTATTGSEGNLRLMQSGMLDLAIVQGDTLQRAIENGGGFLETPLKGVSALGALYTEACQIVTSADSGITSISDLAGKRVSIGEEESGVTYNAEQILMANGLTTDRVNASRLSFADSASALEKGSIDAFFCTAGVPTQVITELAERMDIALIPMDEHSIELLCSLYQWYTPFTIPADTYHGQTQDVATVGVRAVLIANNSTVENDLAHTITRNIFENLPETQGILTDAGPGLHQEFAVDGVPAGFHPGAADYYAGQGITVDTISEDDSPDEPQFAVTIDMYQTLALAVGILFLGGWLKKKWYVLEKFCIPSPVVGGLVFAVVSCILYAAGIVELNFDETLRNVCMVIFFTSVGFQANLKVLKSGGLSLVIFLGVVVALIISQNVLALGASSILGIDAAIGMCTGSIPMVGGHGTAGAFGPVLEDLGLPSATTLATAAATFGLIVGSLMGGPVGRRLIVKHDLLKTAVPADSSALVEDEEKHRRSVRGYAPAAYQLAIAMGIGTIISWLLSQTGMNFPIYIGAMIVAAVMRNFSEYTNRFEVPMGEINDLGGICLSLYLGIAMITLKLWQLADLALPLLALLGVQVVLMFVFAYFIVFNAMGRDYDAAVLSAGSCGFGMGATPNAMANMQAITEQFLPSVKAYILVPIVGSMFADFINSIVITFFINMI